MPCEYINTTTKNPFNARILSKIALPPKNFSKKYPHFPFYYNLKCIFVRDIVSFEKLFKFKQFLNHHLK
jgi:hypothetical protein